MARREFELCDMPVDIHKVQMGGTWVAKKVYRNLYAGDLDRCTWLVTTYYDTPIKSFSRRRAEAFTSGFRFRDLVASSVVSMLLVLGAAEILWSTLIPPLRQSGVFSIWGLVFVIVLFLTCAAVIRLREGIARRGNVIRNSSSLMVIFQLANVLRRTNSLSHVAFALIDEGCRCELGVKMLSDRLGDRHPRRVYLDAVGAVGSVICFSRLSTPYRWPAIVRSSSSEEELSKGEYLITAGSEDDSNRIHIHIDEKGEIDTDRILSRVSLLESLLAMER
ncbi:hypothetical protein Corgl_0693 [Coriobacterium glomerans PW2]|uniref:Uncharacterized protein n=2 Tax=Coriobacterium TaxID=33870 RepID=F2N7J1_CORGP|nr:hypothetical protein Corgl_0693 [Coriobacterium glomerans PW2]